VKAVRPPPHREEQRGKGGGKRRTSKVSRDEHECDEVENRKRKKKERIHSVRVQVGPGGKGEGWKGGKKKLEEVEGNRHRQEGQSISPGDVLL